MMIIINKQLMNVLCIAMFNVYSNFTLTNNLSVSC